MKSQTLPLAALAATALALTACGASDDTEAAAPVVDVQTASAAPTEVAETIETVQPVYILGTPSDLTGQEWADEKIGQWWELEGANSFAGYMHPYSSIESWSAPTEGDLVITLESGAQLESDAETDGWGSLAQITDVGAWFLYCVAPDVETITAQTADGSESYTTHRDSVPGESDTSDEYCH